MNIRFYTTAVARYAGLKPILLAISTIVMQCIKSMIDETPSPAAPSLQPTETTRLEEFSKTATAAKMSGSYHKTAGFLKQKLGELTDDTFLIDAGRNQQILGRVHRLVGSLRSAREAALEKFNRSRTETQAICRKHGARFLDVASDFVEDLKKTLLK
jgi:uncharacterized protein YjbJ (UPF0337 family)